MPCKSRLVRPLEHNRYTPGQPTGMLYVYFDIETSGLDPGTAKLKCAVFRRADETVVVTTTTEETVDYIVKSPKDSVFVTFNGGGFDFRFLAAQLTCPVQKGQLAHVAVSRHIDIMLDFLADHGYRASMASFGAKIPGVGKTWNGAAAAEAPDEDLEKVIDYCKNDVRVLQTIHEAGINQQFLRRLTSSDREQLWILPRENAFRTVKMCIAMAARMPPDQGWMAESSKINVENTMKWCEECLAGALA